MSKITFRADDELVDAVEALDASKSEVMREALRAYLNVGASPDAFGHRQVEESLDDIVARRVEAALDERLADQRRDRELTLNIRVDEETASQGDGGMKAADVDEPTPTVTDAASRPPASASRSRCAQCGTDLDPNHAYCPSCGERTTQAMACECGEPLDPGWDFCPDCGRRTASVEFLER